MYIQVNASDLAKFTGHNRYCTDEERRTAFWARNRPLARRLGVEVGTLYETKVEEVVAQMSSEERECLCKVNELPTSASSGDVAHALRDRVVVPAARETTHEKLDANMATKSADALVGVSTALAAQLKDAFERDVRVQHGIEREGASIDAYERTAGISIVARNDECHRLHAMRWRDYDVVFVGKVDGRDAATGEVIEIKERRRRLFAKIPDYERVQLHCYMRMTDTRRSLLRQRYDDASQEHTVDFDDDFWTECIERLSAFLDEECGARLETA